MYVTAVQLLRGIGSFIEQVDQLLGYLHSHIEEQDLKSYV